MCETSFVVDKNVNLNLTSIIFKELKGQAMRRVVFALAGLLALSACMDATSDNIASRSSVAPPKFFIAQTLGPSCAVDERGNGRSQSAAAAALNRLNANSAQYVADLRQSTSLTVNHEAYSANWQPVLFNSYAAASTTDAQLARTIIDGLKQLARNQRYLNEPGLLTRAQALQGPPCYSQGANTPCPTHTPRFVARMYANLLISAAVLESFMSDDDRQVLIPWFDQGYRKFVAPELAADPAGVYDFANMGLARLAYAALKKDMGLAQQELSARRSEFLKYFEASGYITENSYRGVRGFWYHTYGLDPALSYALVAREWGVNYFTDPRLGPRLAAAVQKTELGIRDHAAFRTVGNRGSSFSTDPADTHDFVHQFALNLYAIAAREFGVRLPPSPMHQRLSRLERYSTISGLSARCYYSNR